MSNAATNLDTPETPTTESVLVEMLTENTGRALLDSGDHYGRNHERNQGVDFESQPVATVDKYGFQPTLSVYHWLCERVSFAPEIDAQLQEFCSAPERERTHYLEDMEEFVETHYPDATGIYGDGKPFTVNTYNGECSLSQTLQFHFFRVNDETSYIALQIHGGCDVRGGYTAPRVFEVTDDDASIFSVADVSAHCNNEECEASWYSDNGGYNFYANDGETDLESGDLKADEDGNYLCPECGKGHLLP